MSQYKIYGESYELRDTPDGNINSYAVKGKLVDIPPKGKSVGYVTMEDDSIIECYKAKPVLAIVTSIALLFLAIGGVASYYMFFQPKDIVLNPQPSQPGSAAEVGEDVTPIVLKQGDDNNVVSYNGFTSLSEGSVNLNFQNGDYSCTITVTGEGIESQTLTVAPGEFIQSVPVTYTTDEGLVSAVLTISTDTSTSEQAFMIEIPENNTPNSPQGTLDGYWKGEYIYVPTGNTE